GFGGQSFIPSVLDKVGQLRRWVDDRGLSTRIEIDGGISPKTARAAAEAGADVLVAGSAVFCAQPIPSDATFADRVSAYRDAMTAIRQAAEGKA
ncbi:MAG: ribulose-phosphate 3-epimerase, partial [Myxococcales bacterium]|nr:ribulose-phosphate 3-epimerase [Myxococcales bacterium]